MIARTATRQDPKTSPDTCLPDLPHNWPDLPRVRPPFSGLEVMERALARLASVHLRLTLCRVLLPCDRRDAERVARALHKRALIAATDRNGGLLLLFIGPRATGSGGDAEIQEAILSDLQRALREIGLGSTFEATWVALLHCWADMIDLGAILSGDLAMLRFRPVHALNRVAA